jgi:hypothetical protein
MDMDNAICKYSYTKGAIEKGAIGKVSKGGQKGAPPHPPNPET